MMDVLIEFDKFDCQIFGCLQGDFCQLVECIVVVIGLLVMVVQCCIWWLCEVGVIVSECLVLDVMVLVFGLLVWVEVVLCEVSCKVVIDGFKCCMVVELCVQQCFYVVGDSDFLLFVCCCDVIEFEVLICEFFFDDVNI